MKATGTRVARFATLDCITHTKLGASMNPITDVTLAEYFALLCDGRRMRCTPVYRVCDCGCLAPLGFTTVLVSNDRGDGRPPLPVRVRLDWSLPTDHTTPADLITNN